MRNKGYILDKFLGENEYHDFVDEEGYKYHVQLNNFLRKDNFKKFETFHVHNKYTIENIKHYIKLHNIDVELVSTEYHRNTDNLQFRCSCGNIFERTWSNFSHKRQHNFCCDECSYKLRSGTRDDERIYKVFEELDIKPIIPLRPNQPVTEWIDLIDSNGFLYYQKIQNLYILHKNRAKNELEKVSTSNPYTIYNINLFLKKCTGNFICISKIYTRNTQKLEILHKDCGTIFKMSWSDIQEVFRNHRENLMKEYCSFCRKHKTESYHASVLKQVFMHEHPDTTLEENSCINPLTSHRLPTDIVNHRLKIAIEVQSSRHDNDYQKEKDTYKKQFWINKGYAFYDPDIRDYGVLELVQMFFPKIEKIPDYVSFGFSDRIDYALAQEYLDNGLTTKEIGEKMGVKISSIRSAVAHKNLTLPDNYMKEHFNWQPIVRLNFDGDLLDKYASISEAARKGFNHSNIQAVLKQKRLQAYDSIWIYGDDYNTGNYTIYPNDVPLDRVDKNGNILKTYSTIYEAEKESCLSKDEIKRTVFYSNIHRSKGEYWQLHK